MTESTLLNYTTADFSTKADMEIRIYRWQEQRDKYLPKLQAKGMLHLNGCDYDNAIDFLNRAHEINPKGVPFYETMLLFCHLGKNDWVSANQSVDRSMRENDHSRFHAFKAIVLAHEGKIEESKEWLKKYQENRPEIKTIDDYEQVVPQINQEVKDILLNGMIKAGLK